MRRFKLTKRDEFIIRKIDETLPRMFYHTRNESKAIQRKWIRNLLSRLFTVKWPNGEFLVAGSWVEWISKNWLGTSKHDKNHKRRMRRAALKHGKRGVISYLNGLGIKSELVERWTDEMSLQLI